MISSRMPLARRPGIRAPGRAVVTTLRVCQKIPSWPEGSVVKTNCERFSRGRSRTRSMATPLRRHSVTGTCSRISAPGGHPSSTRAQKTRLVRGHVSRTLRVKPPSIGRRTRYGSRESGSGLCATTKFTFKGYDAAVIGRSPSSEKESIWRSAKVTLSWASRARAKGALPERSAKGVFEPTRRKRAQPWRLDTLQPTSNLLAIEVRWKLKLGNPTLPRAMRRGHVAEVEQRLLRTRDFDSLLLDPSAEQLRW